MNLRNQIYKATLLIDLKGETEKAIELLRNSLSENFHQAEIADAITAKVFLGQLLFEKNELNEALLHLQESVKMFNSLDIEADLIETEIIKAKKLLELLEKKEIWKKL